MAQSNFLHSKAVAFCAGVTSAFLTTLSFAAVAVASPVAPTHTPYITIVLAHFSEWDRNKNGALDQAELDQLIADPAIKGDQAVAIAVTKIAMHRQQHLKIINPPPFTLAYFARYESEGWNTRKGPGDADAPPAGGAGGAEPTTAPSVSENEKKAAIEYNFDRTFKNLKVKLSRVNDSLFTQDPPSQDVIHQGMMGDCFYLSSLGAMIARDPGLLQKMIKPDDTDGHFYRVSFPGSPLVKIAAPTDAEMAIGAGSAGNGIWLPVMEKAFAALMDRRLPPDQQSSELLDVIDHGGDPNLAINLLTGHKTESCVPLHEHTRPAQEVLPGLRQQLSKAFAGHRLVVVSVPPGHVPPGMMPQHSYAATGYDPATDQINIWNPLGRDFSPKGPAGLTNGYPTTHGHFTMPLTEFFSVYRSAVFETDAATTKPT